MKHRNLKSDLKYYLRNDIADWDKDFDPLDYKEEYLRVLKPNGNLFSFTSYNTIGRWHEVYDPIFDTFQFFIWHKTNQTPKFIEIEIDEVYFNASQKRLALL